ncbi:AAA family ATPase, partial [Kineococcus sp. R8]|uniref:AAA family ATPase n=1 Tax=Kineococcus siccus TaxID=2696567 RepID=UPI0014125C0C|nr:AAA family ATPase [Kineococcus siccus]
MRLHRLRLDDFRGVEHRELVLPDAGVVVLEGANEIGKTSMVDALDMLLTEKHSSKKAWVLAAKPVHRDAPSAVEAELSSGPYRFTYRKQWHQRPATTLTVTAPRPEQATGEEAHARVQQILAETLDEGLWRALRLLQGTPLDTTALSGSSALTAALDAAAGTTSASDDSETLLGAVAQRAAEFFTATGRPTGRLRAALEEHESARAEAAAAQRGLAEVAGDVERHARLVAARERLGQHRRETERAAAGHREVVAALAQLRDRRERATADADAAHRAAAEAHERARARHEQRT